MRFQSNVRCIQGRLYSILLGLNNTAKQMSKTNSYYPPKINVDRNQEIDSLIKEIDKLEIFLRFPELSYLSKNNNKIGKINNK